MGSGKGYGNVAPSDLKNIDSNNNKIRYENSFEAIQYRINFLKKWKGNGNE